MCLSPATSISSSSLPLPAPVTRHLSESDELGELLPGPEPLQAAHAVEGLTHVGDHAPSARHPTQRIEVCVGRREEGGDEGGGRGVINVHNKG